MSNARWLLAAVLIAGSVGATMQASEAASGEARPGGTLQPAADGGPVYVAYYWRARPGRESDYNQYIRGTAERIDEDARKAGAFIEIRTVLATRPPDGSVPDWTHLRIFTLKDMAAVDALAKALDEATLRVVPDEAQRKANSARSAEMRDLVRREVWTTLR
jgi:hypothetical protein